MCDWGCATWSLLDFRHPVGQLWDWEEGDRHKLDLTLSEWLQAWLDGVLTQPPWRPELRLESESWSRSEDSALWDE